MAHLLSLKLVCLILFFSFSPSSASQYDLINKVCKASKDPQACQAWMLSNSSTHLSPNATVLEAIQFALKLTTNNLKTGQHLVKRILHDSKGNQNRTNTALICREVLGYSKYRIHMVVPALKSHELMKDARAWMSAALMYQYDCWSGLKYVNGTQFVDDTMAFLNSTLIQGSSSALGMIVNYDLYGVETQKWSPPKTERDHFWEPESHISKWGYPAGLKENVSVCKTKGRVRCTYETVQAAVDASPNNTELGNWFVIRIKNGNYSETVRVPLEKKNVVFWGEGKGKTVITGSKNVGQLGMSTYNSSTVGVVGDGFMAINLTIENTAGSDAHQAVAFRSDSDKSVMINCEFIGNQDTLYAHTLRQYYKSCTIQGNVDFIFGNAAAVFQDCLILLVTRNLLATKKDLIKNVVTAQGRIDPGQSTGFVFRNSLVNGTQAYMDKKTRGKWVTFLGRPWKEYSRTVFIECTLDGLISEEGWLAWKDDFAFKTLYYGEYKNTGPGSSLAKRVNWSNPIPKDHVKSYSPQNFIQLN
ncbi:hypothetical protein CASFOL_012108 [Castilleja foliolosa]|uniref:pectinesterase n=1 Tax=Castilleja foliolosa TaxID=1961234 RepID=A0ABD3DR32_9LAMI